MRLGVNGFGLRKELLADFDGTMHRLKATGFTSFEPCVLFVEDEATIEMFFRTQEALAGGIWRFADGESKIRRIRDHGFDVVSVHVMHFSRDAEEMMAMLPALIEFGKQNDIKYYVISLMLSAAKIESFLPALQLMASELDREGIGLAYHNHEMECVPEDGRTALDLVIERCPDVILEPDVGWIKFAESDAVEIMRKYRHRIRLLHFKDVTEDASAETRDRCFTAIGEGSIPLKEIMEAAALCPIEEDGFIIDQDDSLGNLLDELELGCHNITEFSSVISL